MPAAADTGCPGSYSGEPCASVCENNSGTLECTGTGSWDEIYVIGYSGRYYGYGTYNGGTSFCCDLGTSATDADIDTGDGVDLVCLHDSQEFAGSSCQDHSGSDSQPLLLPSVIDVGADDDEVSTSPTGAHIDDVTGGSGDDVIYTYGGADVVYAGDGYDEVRGGDGADEIRGEGETDTLYGDDGADEILGGDALDYIYGGADNDVLSGEGGNDVIRGQGGEDFIKGGPGNDRIYGGVAGDRLCGDDGADDVWGEDGDDCLCGGSYDATLALNADGDVDDLYGDGGTDTCRHYSAEGDTYDGTCEYYPDTDKCNCYCEGP
jgi:Ca2+-binding RTX toxin-like protein